MATTIDLVDGEKIDGVLTVGELKEILKKYDEDLPIINFVNGDVYPLLGVQRILYNSYEYIELGCGWSSFYLDDVVSIKE